MKKIYSWSRLAGRTLGAAAGLSTHPLKLMFVVTKRCHSKCVYCDIWKAKDTPGALDAELTLTEIQQIAAANPFFQWIDFTGGEPTDRPDFVQVVQAFASTSPHLLLVHFPTNGIASKKISSIVEELHRTIAARVVVTVSIDGPPHLNDRLRGIRNDFSHAIDTLCSTRRLLGNDNVFVGLTLHAFSKTSNISTKELVEQTYVSINEALATRTERPIGWESLHLNIPHLSQHYYGNAAAIDTNDGFGGPEHRAEISEAVKYAAMQTKQGGSFGMKAIERIYRSQAVDYLARGKTSITCSALLLTTYLSEKGEIFPCTIWNKPLGNVRENDFSLMPIIEQARASGVRRDVVDGKCPNCWTPCEAYPAIAASPIRSLASFIRG